MSEDSSNKYYKSNKERLQKKTSQKISKSFYGRKRKKATTRL